MSRWLLPLAFLVSLPIAGCDGCRRDTSNDDETEAQGEPDAFTSSPPIPFPGDLQTLGSGVKPGHWFTASQGLRSNRGDLGGQLETSNALTSSRSGAMGSPLGAADGAADPADRGGDGGRFSQDGGQFSQGSGSSDAAREVRSVRPVVLPRGQMKRFETRGLAPLPDSASARQLSIRNRFVSSRRGVSHDPPAGVFPVMAEQEYFLVILTTRPERFTRLRVADWVRPVGGAATDANYRVVVPPSDGRMPLAETMLDWTSTAVVLWDDLPADALTPNQFRAISDWVRFGGTLVLNGVEATEAVARSPVADLLPSRVEARVELDVASATELLRQWSVASDPSLERQLERLEDGRARVAMRAAVVDPPPPGEPPIRSPDGTGGLVLMRQPGRGRVVQATFDVTGDWLDGWKSYDSFFNAVMLGRPRRRFVEVRGTPEWIEDDLEGGEISRVYRSSYPDLRSDRATSANNTRFRLASRDAALFDGDADSDHQHDTDTDHEGDARPVADRWHQGHPVAGLAAWSDRSDLPRRATERLRAESGIEIPGTSLVIRTLGIYLLVLIPLNYVLFWLSGRVEYAWLAVPVIAAGGAVWVAHVARLDIGFARSQNEIAVLETHPGYGRGHLSRFVAVYNSLSSRYDVTFDNDDSVATPIGTGAESSAVTTEFRTAFASGPTMSGFAVASNQVRLFRAEQLIDLGGDIRLDGDRLINDTTFELVGGVIVDRGTEGATRVARVDRCPAAGDVRLRFSSRSAADAGGKTAAGSNEGVDGLDGVDGLVERLTRRDVVPPGSARLVARIESPIPGMTVTPAAGQSSSHTVVLAHLRHRSPTPPRGDANLIVAEETPKDLSP